MERGTVDEMERIKGRSVTAGMGGRGGGPSGSRDAAFISTLALSTLAANRKTKLKRD